MSEPIMCFATAVRKRIALAPRSTLVGTAIYSALNILALVRWGQPDLFSRIERYSVTAIVLLVGLGSTRRQCVRGSASG
jgi:hypothetical protein